MSQDIVPTTGGGPWASSGMSSKQSREQSKFPPLDELEHSDISEEDYKRGLKEQQLKLLRAQRINECFNQRPAGLFAHAEPS